MIHPNRSIRLPGAWLWALPLLALSVVAGEPNAAPASATHEQSLRIYTAFELAQKAERIVVGELIATADGCTLKVGKELKAPKNDPHEVDPAVLRRAQALLKDENANVPIPPPKAPATIKVLADKNMRLPPAGTQAVFFLWERVLPEAGGHSDQIVYRLAHPQCLYDEAFLAQVQLTLARPRDDGRYLRDWDRQMAQRLRERQADLALLKLKGGEIVQGLRLRATRPALALQANHGLHVAAIIENTRGREETVYDGPLNGYGVILRPDGSARDASEDAVVLRLSAENRKMGVDSSVLALSDVTDYASIPGNGLFSKELFLDAELYPILKKLHGAYRLSLFFVTSMNGKEAELDELAWTGAMVSEAVKVTFPELKNLGETGGERSGK